MLDEAVAARRVVANQMRGALGRIERSLPDAELPGLMLRLVKEARTDAESLEPRIDGELPEARYVGALVPGAAFRVPGRRQGDRPDDASPEIGDESLTLEATLEGL